MRYDPQSAYIFTVTDWASLGAIYDPPDDLPRFGAPLTPEETAALGHARLAAEGSRTGSASETFVQQHPQHATRGIVMVCTAWVDRSGGWSIGLIEPTGQESPWVLKADRDAVLRCACHCDWRRECPGVVSGAGHPPGTDARLRAPGAPPWTPSPAPAPHYPAAPAAPAYAQAEPRRQGFLSAMLFGPARAPDHASPEPAPSYAAPAAVAATGAAAYAAYEHLQPAEEYRGHLHAQGEPRLADAVIEHAWQPEALPEPEPDIPVARAERTGFWGRMFARPTEDPPMIEQQPPVAEIGYEPDGYADQGWAEPQAYGNHGWVDDAIASYQSPEMEEVARYDSLPAIEDWSVDPEPAQLSSQAEIDGFIAAASSYDTPVEYEPAPEPDPEPAAIEYQPDPEPVTHDEPLALPAPEEERQ
ncbi:MAG: hypothetical protein SV862_00070 [Pseudomonadota bacterium]|nr:hypothetical protein [Pseudomonadota bacterium]